MKKQSDFSSDQFAKLMNLFNKKGWLIDTNCDISTFKRYVDMLSQLSKEQQDFVIEISERFLHIGIDKYSDKLIEPLKRLRSDFPDDLMVIAPCLSEEEQGEIKSGSAVLYQLSGNSIKTKVNLGKHSICRSKLDDFMSNMKNDKFKVVLVDDFVGTGESAWNAVRYVKRIRPSLECNDILIVCIVAMQTGIDYLAEKGIHTYCTHIEKRGISDYYSGSILEHATKLMSEIEAKIKVKKNFHFGYGHSEALVCMERCPNNTFPIYWLQKNAPYAR